MKKSKIRLLCCIAILTVPVLCTANNNFRFYDSRNTFLADLYRLKIGDSKDKVDEIMGKYLKGTNWPTSGKQITIPGTKREKFEIDTSKTDQLTLKNCEVFRHSNEGKYDSDWGIICYKNNIVEYLDFAHD